MKVLIVIFVVAVSEAFGDVQVEQEYTYQPSNYDLSRNRQLSNNIGFGLSQMLDYLLGNNNYGGYYPQRPGGYPGGQYGGGYPDGQYGGGYPEVAGPPGAHPGCPLCDSSVYSYCYNKQSHDSCCCDGGSNSYYSYCRKRDCTYLHANSCQEYRLISNCCCIDVQKKAGPTVAPVVA